MSSLVRRVHDAQPALFWAGLGLLALMLPSTVAAGFDDRLLNGINVWIKPLKFQASAGVYLLTLGACFLALPRGADRRRSGRYVVWASIVTAWFEVVYITIMAARGEASHWNFSSAFTGFMYTAMGAAALVLSSTSAVLGVMIARDRAVALDPALRHGLVAGLVLSFVLGAAFGVAMSAGQGHWVGGTPSDAQGLPLFKWSRDGGDLRVAHFFGLHAMHFIPAFAWLASRAAAAARARALTYTFAAAFTVFTVLTFMQAMMGRPFLPA